MSRGPVEKPTIVIPYTGTSDDHTCRDIFVYLRPETNGVLAESSLLRVIENSSLYRECIELIYLANIPGEFIIENEIVEDHYRHKMPFARHGGSLFTENMQNQFERYFLDTFDAGKVIGAFEALEVLNLTEEELFQIRVPAAKVLNLNCQVVKKIDDIYIVNYDIPALLHKNSNSTDIAVMLFRSTLENPEFHNMIEKMEESLKNAGILPSGVPSGRAFHYSRGPFEQILDARGHLYSEDGVHVSLSDMQFCSFLRSKGILCDEVERILDNPIMEFPKGGGIVEECLYAYTQDASYQTAYEILASSVSQFVTELAELAKLKKVIK
jgi:hypothetical protein